MKRFVLIALVGCSSSNGPHIHPLDAPRDSRCLADQVCNPLTQAGCSLGEKCTWIDEGSNASIGIIGCAPDGSAGVGQACQYAVAFSGACGSFITDNCMRGAVCSGGICKAICDNQGGTPMCGSDEACVVDPALFSTGSMSPHAAGVCVPACDPLADNDFLGSGVRGSGCTAGSGCYGAPSGGTPPATQFWCSSEGSGVNRSAAANDQPNACAQGYEPLVHDATGSTTIVCVALCSPADTYLGGPQAPLGNAPHRCATSDARGTFGAHEHCMYLWPLEIDGSGNWLPSPSSNTVGVCIDHSLYRYDSNQDGVIDGSDATWPDCATLPLSGSDVVAAEFGCVSTTTAPALPAAPAPGL